MVSNGRNIKERSQMNPDQIERLKALEAENLRLKGEVAILTVDKLILGEIVDDTIENASLGRAE
jgi:hypothetical protein